MTLALRLTRLRAVVNLNAPRRRRGPATWPTARCSPAARPRPAPDRLARLADGLLAALLHPEAEIGRVRINWHLSEPDFRPEAADRLKSVAHSTLNGSAIGFVFDRPRRDVRLAVGVDRRHPAALLTVGLHLPRLAEQPGVDGDPARFVKKLGSLARLALSAGVQKRDFLRRREASGASPVTSGFLLDRRGSSRRRSAWIPWSRGSPAGGFARAGRPSISASRSCRRCATCCGRMEGNRAWRPAWMGRTSSISAARR